MIRTDLLDVVNSGSAWLFVGSGVSIDAGLPSWDNLVTEVLKFIGSEHVETITKDRRFAAAVERRDYPTCFERIENLVGKEQVRTTIQQIVRRVSEPGAIVKQIVDWPSQGYVTTNYDHLLELGLHENNLLGWIPVGNSPTEIQKASGDVKNIVWHIHGSAEMLDNQSRLVLTTRDYDDVYLESSALQQQLRGFLTQRRFVFIGFGFNDPEIGRLLRLVGRYTVPERPIYAFLGASDWSAHENALEELRDKYNIDVIRYRIVEGSHKDLNELLAVYGSMVIRRSISYNIPRRSAPSYDAETTGLLIYNTLVLQGGHTFPEDVLNALLSARILSLAKFKGGVSLGNLDAMAGESAALLAQQQVNDSEVDPKIQTGG